jgi:hypothetical protein
MRDCFQKGQSLFLNRLVFNYTSRNQPLRLSFLHSLKSRNGADICIVNTIKLKQTIS